MNPDFLHWVQTRLIEDIKDEFPNDTHFEPTGEVHPDYHWLTPLISNTLTSMADYPDFDPEDRMQLYLGFERNFDCHEKECAVHSSWSIHIKRLNDDAENIGEALDICCLHLTVEDWLQDFLQLKFPSITFDYDSLLNNDSLLC